MLFVCFVFFFFKQKTAYEMRISDWSSDVCSSDLTGRLLAIGKRLLPHDTNAESIGMLAFKGEGAAIFRNQIDQMMRTPEGVERWYLRAIDIIAKGNRVGTEIGRAHV